MHHKDILMPTLESDFQALSTHPNLSIDWLTRFPNEAWRWTQVSQHPNIHIEMILDHLELPWHMECVGHNPNMTMEFVHNPVLNTRFLQTTWLALTLNRSISIQDMLDHSHLPWRWSAFVHRQEPEITLEFLLSLHCRVSLPSPIRWQIQFLSAHPNITVEDVNAHPEIQWDWVFLSQNPNMTQDFVDNNFTRPWSWFWLSKNGIHA